MKAVKVTFISKKPETKTVSAKDVAIGYFLGRKDKEDADLVLYQKNYECITIVATPGDTWSAANGNLGWCFYDYEPVEIEVIVKR